MEMKHALPLLCLFLGCSSTYKSPTIVEWRGEDRNGIYHDASLLRSWPEEGPRQLWFFDSLGSGYGSPVIEKGFIYITGAHDSTAWLHCLDAKGILQWQVPYGREWVVNFPGSRSAPTLVEDLIYVGSGTGELVCLEKANGEVRWSRKFEGAESLGLPRFGHSESAVVDADLVFWTPGGSDHNVVALNRFTGELQWSNPGFGERSAYHPPRVISHAGRRILVCMSAYHLMGMDAETGSLLWSLEMEGMPPEKRSPGKGDTHANTSLFEDGMLYLATGDDGNFGQKLKLSEDGSGISEVWQNKHFDPYMGGIVKRGDHLYGGGTRKPWLMSVHTKSGKLSDSLLIGRGALIAAGPLLFYYTYQGEVNLVSYNEAGQLNLISSFSIERGEQEHFAHPVIHQGVLYIRHGEVLMAFDIQTP